MIGKMKDRITVKMEQKADNERGGWIVQEKELGTFWGHIEPLREANIVQYRQADKQTNTRIKMRSNDAITVECLLYARGHIYRIDEVIDKDGFLTLLTVGERIGQLHQSNQ